MLVETAEAIRIRGLEKTFPGFHLGPLDLNVPKGAIYGLIGANGAGKTTTIDLIMGMGAKEAGEIAVFGFDHIRDEVEMKKRTGYVSPDLNFNAWGTVRRLIGFIRAFYADWDDDYCTELLDRLKIGWTDKIATLSYGSRTKLALIVALAHRPALLLLDEPTAGLDAISKKDLFTELLDAVQDEERTVLISSHNLDDLQRFTDHIGIIDQRQTPRRRVHRRTRRTLPHGRLPLAQRPTAEADGRPNRPTPRRRPLASPRRQHAPPAGGARSPGLDGYHDDAGDVGGIVRRAGEGPVDGESRGLQVCLEESGRDVRPIVRGRVADALLYL